MSVRILKECVCGVPNESKLFICMKYSMEYNRSYVIIRGKKIPVEYSNEIFTFINLHCSSKRTLVQF